MTEDEWLSGTDVFRMLEHVGEAGGARKLRLFACACCRRHWADLIDPRVRLVVELMEAEADRSGAPFLERAEVALRGAHGTARRAARPRARTTAGARCRAFEVVLFAAEGVTIAPENSPLSKPVGALHDIFGGMGGHVAAENRLGRPSPSALSELCALVRDAFGNPFRPVAFAPEWRTDTALILARGMYESREFGAMPILADALQDAGCDNPDILNHCRGEGPHVRGCWACDLVLGLE